MELDIHIADTILSATKSEGNLSINGEKIAYSTKKLSETKFVIYYNDKAFVVEKVKSDQKDFEIKVNRKSVNASIKDSLDKTLEKLGMDTLLDETVNEVLAPMPGSIVNILVKEGDEVKKGDTLVILEAMKMENIIKSPADATVSSVNVEKGQNVDKNHPLVIF